MSDRPSEAAERRELCDHICMLDAGHVERGESHYYCYELPAPRRGPVADLSQIKADAAWMARCSRSSSWPADMAQRVEDAAARVIAWADADPARSSTGGTETP